ncbi:MAG: hypothetical protein ACUVRX_00820 [Actinomycetota bacterium]
MGYCTLYGTWPGGFAVIKDPLKVRVYRLRRHIGRRRERRSYPPPSWSGSQRRCFGRVRETSYSRDPLT